MSRPLAQFVFILICAAALTLSGCTVPRMLGGYYPSYHKPRLPSGQGEYHNNSPYTEAGRTYYPLQSATGYDKTGIASWYGRDFHGNLTADGERYDMYALSAAHRTLPLPTLVRVTNLENGRAVVVRVNDRGPFVKNRLIDLSYAAALELGFAKQGTTRVRVQSLDTSAPTTASRAPRPAAPAPAAPAPAAPAPAAPAPAAPAPAAPAPAAPAPAKIKVAKEKTVPGMYIQLGAFGEITNARRMRSSLSADYPSVRVEPTMMHKQRLYRVRIGPYTDVHDIEHIVLELQRKGFDKAIVVIQ